MNEKYNLKQLYQSFPETKNYFDKELSGNNLRIIKGILSDVELSKGNVENIAKSLATSYNQQSKNSL